MIIDHRKYNQIDYKKYKRVFMFGCSFTNYWWPTWAQVISLECEDATLYNCGKVGGGNLFIASQFAAANQKYRFNNEDLILIMWSTHCREDRYKDTQWITPGNIWSQNIISESFVKEWACVKGYLVRDLALMSLVKHTAMTLPCDIVNLRSVDPLHDDNLHWGQDSLSDVVDLYRDVVYDTAPPLYQFVKDNRGGWINGHEYYWPGLGNSTETVKFKDYHPNPVMYMDYLTNIGFQFSDKTAQNVRNIHAELMTISHINNLRKFKPMIDNKYFPSLIDEPHLI